MPQTANKGFEVPTRGSEVGTWDVPVNFNMEELDDILSEVTAIPLTNANYTLSAQEQRVMLIRFNGVVTANLNVTFSMAGFYIIENNCNVGTNRILLRCAGAGENIVAPPGSSFNIYCDGVNIRFVNLGPTGMLQYWYTNALPDWVNFCTVKPYLLCNGQTFVGGDYPALNRFLGGNTLPDFRSRVLVPLDNMGVGGAAGIITSVNTGNGTIVGATLGSFGGSPLQPLIVANMPSHNHGGASGAGGAHVHSYLDRGTGSVQRSTGGNSTASDGSQTRDTDPADPATHTHTISAQGSNTDHNNMQPSRMSGILVIKT